MRSLIICFCLLFTAGFALGQVPTPQGTAGSSGPGWSKTAGEQFVLRDANGNQRNNTLDLKYLGTDSLAVLDRDTRTLYLLNDFKNASTGANGTTTVLSSYVGSNFYITTPYAFAFYLDDVSITGPFVNIKGSYYYYVEEQDATFLLPDIRKFPSWGAQTARKLDYSVGNVYWYRDVANGEYGLFEKGDTIDYDRASTRKDGNDLIILIDNIETYRLPDYYSAASFDIKPAVQYNAFSDVSTNSSGTGCVSGNCNDGWGKYVYEGEQYYDGFWQGGKRHGYGLYKWPGSGKYIGSWNNDQMRGYGVYIADNNDNIIGWYENGNLNGLGITVSGEDWKQGIFSNGNVSTAYSYYSNNVDTGCTAGDCQSKYGKFVWSNGDQFIGFWKNGSMHMGTYTFASGDKYSGMFNSSNQFDGMGRFFFQDGAYYGGMWKNGQYHGTGYYHNKDLVSQIGEWANGSLVRSMK